jgi:hypothetical protein
LTDGVELVVFRMQESFDDVRELACPVAEIPRHWARLRALLGYEPVLRYCAENRIKSRVLPAAGYSDYLRVLLSELAEEVEASMERAVSSIRADDGAISAGVLLPGGGSGDFPVGVGGERLESAPYRNLLGIGSSVIVLAEPGGGKSRLTVEQVGEPLSRYESRFEAATAKLRAVKRPRLLETSHGLNRPQRRLFALDSWGKAGG